MNITKTALSLTAPDKRLAGIYLKGIAAHTPASELKADVIDDGFSFEFVGDPGGGETTVVLPF